MGSIDAPDDRKLAPLLSLTPRLVPVCKIIEVCCPVIN